MPGIIFDIQPYSIYDGPGIRTCVYFKGCHLRCYWCHNPESQSPSTEMAYWRERCAACGECADVCPEGALKLDGSVVIRDRDKCKACGKCADACPNKAMEVIGRIMSAESVTELALKDKPFYENSGGGVTITGGEPVFQKKFLLELLDSLKAAGIHTALETCGYFPREDVPELVERVDLFLYDLKHIDPKMHEQGTGASSELVLDNFRDILKRAGVERIIPRIPLVPGFNTDENSIRAFTDFLENAGYHGRVHLMPYHGWAKGKYERTGRAESYKTLPEIEKEELEKIAAAFSEKDFEPICYG